MLGALSVLLYHTVESSLIAAGAKMSEKFKHHAYTFGVKNHSAEGTAQIFSE